MARDSPKTLSLHTVSFQEKMFCEMPCLMTGKQTTHSIFI